MRPVTNNDLRDFLSLPRVKDEFSINQVDALGTNNDSCTLMFINRPGVSLTQLDRDTKRCVYLVDKELYRYYSLMESDANDFIFIENPKYKFCLLVKEFSLQSRLQCLHKASIPTVLGHSEYCHCSEVIIGKRCEFDKGVIIGGTDFSPVLADDNSLVQFPQLGGVIIGDDVVIKYNSMIGKGTFGYTFIGENTMIDYGCQIGHNCYIGEHCIIAAGSIIGGSTTVGDNTVIGIGAKIRNGLKIGQGVSIGMGSVVIEDIPDNCVVVGNPARIIEHKRIFDKGGLV